jgi:hypothetical protein
VAVRGGALYFRNTRLLPVPSFLFNGVGAGPRDPQAFTITPRPSVNSVDGVLLTTQIRYPLSPDPTGTALNADLGVSARVGFRGGVALEAPTRVGTFSLGLRKNDIVTTQLTNRIILDRLPELSYSSRFLPVFQLPGKRLAGIRLNAGTGRFNERIIGGSDYEVDTSRTRASINFTTRGNDVAGPYFDVFARVTRYGNTNQSYRNSGFEVGYAGRLLPRILGALSYRSTTVSGDTPFRFDRVEIRRELRSTFDFELTPRYLIPIDLRYDLDRKQLRDKSIGILRSYKTFAYGLTYRAARNEIGLEVREGF